MLWVHLEDIGCDMPTEECVCDELAALLAECIVHYEIDEADLARGIVSNGWGYAISLAEVAGWIERNSVLDRGWTNKRKRLRHVDARPLRERWSRIPFVFNSERA